MWGRERNGEMREIRNKLKVGNLRKYLHFVEKSFRKVDHADKKFFDG